MGLYLFIFMNFIFRPKNELHVWGNPLNFRMRWYLLKRFVGNQTNYTRLRFYAIFTKFRKFNSAFIFIGLPILPETLEIRDSLLKF